MKQHVCMDARLISASGIGTFIQGMLPAFDKSQFLLTLLAYEKDRDIVSCFADRLIGMKSDIYTAKEQAELALRIPRCDVFWSPHFNVPLLPIAAKKRLCTIHDAYHLTFFPALSLRQKIYARLFYFAACKLSNRLTTVSEFSRHEIVRHFPFAAKKLAAIRLGTAMQLESGDEFERIKNKYGLPERYLLTVTNFKPHKNFERIKTACQGILPLVAIGKKGKDPSICYTGYVEKEEMASIYANAAALVFASLYEGFGCPALEAMACGCPVIASNCASLPEVCEKAAEYVDPLDTASIRQGILRVVNHPRRRQELRQKGKLRAKEMDIKLTAQKHIELIRQMG